MIADSKLHKFAGIRYVFLDRDGTLNRKPPEGQYVARLEDLRLLPGAAEAVAILNAEVHAVILVTNQRGISLDLVTKEQLNQVHDCLGKKLAECGAHLDAIYYCPHDPGQYKCQCRKPEVGLFERAFRDFPDASSENSLMIGDSLVDIQAGHRLGMRTIFIVGDPTCGKADSNSAGALADAVATSLKDAVEKLMQLSCQ